MLSAPDPVLTALSALRLVCEGMWNQAPASWRPAIGAIEQGLRHAEQARARAERGDSDSGGGEAVASPHAHGEECSIAAEPSDKDGRRPSPAASPSPFAALAAAMQRLREEYARWAQRCPCKCRECIDVATDIRNVLAAFDALPPVSPSAGSSDLRARQDRLREALGNLERLMP